MIYISILAGISGFLFLIILFYYLNITINTGYLIAFFLFFDIYAFILSKIITFVTPLIFLVLISIFVIIISFLTNYNKFIEALKRKEITLWILFTIYLFLSLLWTPNHHYGLFKFQIYLIKGFLPGLAIYFSFYVYRKMSWAPAIVSGLLYILVFFFLKQDSAYFTHRMTIKGSNPIWISRATLLYVSIILIAFETKLIYKTLLAIPGLIAAFLAQSKGPFIGLFAGFLGYYYFQYRKENQTVNKWLFFLKIMLSMLTIILFFNLLIESFDVLKNSRFAVLFSIRKLFSEPTFLERVVRFTKAINIFIHNLFFGVGIGGFSPVDQRNYPHNIVLEIGSELGVFGLTIWSVLIYKVYQLSKLNKIFLILFLQTLTYAMFSGDLGFNNEYVLISFMILSMSSIYSSNNKELSTI